MTNTNTTNSNTTVALPEVQSVLTYSFIDFCQEVQKYIQLGYEFDFNTNENYPNWFGSAFSCNLLLSTAKAPEAPEAPEGAGNELVETDGGTNGGESTEATTELKTQQDKSQDKQDKQKQKTSSPSK